MKVDDIQVNILNPRYVPQESEIEEMSLIIEKGNSFLNLLKDIATYGMDPSENLLLTSDDEGMYIVEEGNRRLTAMKLLNNPNLVPAQVRNRDAVITKINKIRTDSNYKPITRIHSVILDDEEKLQHFIKLKHTGENGGAGRMRWDTESKIRFDGSNIFRRYVLDLVKSIVTDKTEGLNITTMERILGDPDMRNLFSIKLDKTEPSIVFETPEGKELFIYVIQGIANGTYNVKNVHSKQDRLDFIEYLKGKDQQAEGKENTLVVLPKQTDPNQPATENPTTPQQESVPTDLPKPPDKKTDDPEQPTIPIPPRPRTRRQPEPKDRKYPFQGVNYNGDVPGIKHALFELQSISDIYKYSLAATVLFRTFIECTLQEYILVSGIPIQIRDNKSIKDLSIDSLLQTCCNSGNGNLKKLKEHNNLVARVVFEANSKRDQDELNVVAHGNYRTPSAEALQDIERRWFEVIKLMITEISGQK